MAFEQSRSVICALCMRSDENDVTGRLAKTEDIAAHQNCLLFASGIFSKNTPTIDDLFGFTVEDVKTEQRRGRRLFCHQCGKKGATVGCEVRQCKRSYHYPCAIRANAKPIEHFQEGVYQLYCENHASLADDDAVNHQPDVTPSSACLSNHKRSHAVGSLGGTSSKGTSGFPSRQKAMSQPSMSRGKRRKIVDSSDSEDSRVSVDFECAPLESDLDDCTPPKQQKFTQLSGSIKENTDESRLSSSAIKPPPPCDDADETRIDSDDHSPSLLLPVHVCVVSERLSSGSEPDSGPGSPAAAPSAPCDQRAGEDPRALPSGQPLPGLTHPPKDSSLSTSLRGSAPPGSSRRPCSPEGACSPRVGVRPQHPETTSPHPQPGPSALADASVPPAEMAVVGAAEGEEERAGASPAAELFWGRCNEAGCTAAIFSKLLAYISHLAQRVQDQQASQQDYDVCLRVLEASGKLHETLAQLENDFEDRERELQRKSQALQDARKALGGMTKRNSPESTWQ